MRTANTCMNCMLSTMLLKPTLMRCVPRNPRFVLLLTPCNTRHKTRRATWNFSDWTLNHWRPQPQSDCSVTSWPTWHKPARSRSMEINLDALLGHYPPSSSVVKPPAFPSIERDLSVVVEESIRWDAIQSAIASINPQLLTDISYIGTFRGKQVSSGRKSVSFRMTFQDPSRTLRHEEVDPQVQSVLRSLRDAVGAELRG